MHLEDNVVVAGDGLLVEFGIMNAAAPILFAVVIWYFSTGVLLYLNGLPRWTFSSTITAATAVAGIAAIALWHSSQDQSVSGAYIAFLASVAIWAWLELLFYLGYVTGPRQIPSAPDCRGFDHFIEGVETCLYHQLFTLGVGFIMFAALWGASNTVGLWTFMILWGMQQSAKLNVFFGVRNLNAHFLPDHLAFLGSFLKERPINFVFPFSVTIGTLVAAGLILAATGADVTAAERAGLILLATMMVLAVVEHWLLILPIPAEKLWEWSLRARRVGTSHASAAPTPPQRPVQKPSQSNMVATTATGRS